MPYQKHSTRAICRLFNPKDKSDVRAGLRGEWADMRVGPVTLENVERVLRSLAGATLSVRGATYTLSRVPRYGIGSRDVWRFTPPSDGIETFIRLLRTAIGERGARLDDICALLAEGELGEIAASLLYRDLPLTRQQVSSLLSRGCKYRRVDGVALVRTPSGVWTFVERG